MCAAVTHGHTGAAKQIAGLLLPEHRRQALPKQGNAAAVAIIGMNAGATNFQQFAVQLQHRIHQEFALRIEATGLGGTGTIQQASAANQLFAVAIEHVKMLAMAIKRIPIQAFGIDNVGAQLLGENLIAQSLQRPHFCGAGGEANLETVGFGKNGSTGRGHDGTLVTGNMPASLPTGRCTAVTGN